MTFRAERSRSRFVVANTDDGKLLIRLAPNDTGASLGSIAVGFELLSGKTPEVARTLVDVMNERIVGVVVAPK